MSTHSIGLSKPLGNYLRRVGVRESAILAELRADTQALTAGHAKMQIAPETGAFLAMLVRLTGANQIIEVGTFTGYSALCMAQALPDDGHLLACDVSQRWIDIAQRYWAQAGVMDRITLKLAPALDTLAAARAEGDARFDLAFIDADKTNYTEYYEACLALLRPGGLIVIDNTLWSGQVADESVDDPDTTALRALNTQLSTDERIDLSMLPLADGVTLARKRGA